MNWAEICIGQIIRELLLEVLIKEKSQKRTILFDFTILILEGRLIANLE